MSADSDTRRGMDRKKKGTGLVKRGKYMKSERIRTKTATYTKTGTRKETGAG